MRSTLGTRPRRGDVAHRDGAEVSTKDERRERQERFARLDAGDRRAIVKAVNRGRAVETRKHAPLAVHMAQRQMRFWKWSWLIGPAVGLLQIGQLGPVAAVINAVVASAFLGAMSAFFYLRARRAEEANLALTDRTRPAPRREATQPDARRGEAGSARTEDAARQRTPRRWWGGRDRRPQTSSGSGSAGHLPGEAPSPEPTDDHAAGGGSDSAGPPAAGSDRRPYQPRGRKRRRR